MSVLTENEFGLPNVLITQGESGELIFDGNEIYFHQKVELNPYVTVWMLVFKDGITQVVDIQRDVAEIVVRKGDLTPIQYFTSDRIFVDVPTEGRAFYLAQSPDGEIRVGEYDSERDKNVFFQFGKGWVFAWIPKFKDDQEKFCFTEICFPAFISESLDYPKGEDGIVELNRDDPSSRDYVQPVFWVIYDLLA